MSDANRSELEKRSDWERRQRASAGPRAPEPSVVEVLDLLPRGLALDIAAGTGRHSLLLGRAGFRVVAIDYAEPALRTLQSIARAEKLSVWPLVADHRPSLCRAAASTRYSTSIFSIARWFRA